MNLVVLDVPQTHYKCNLIRFCSALPLSHSAFHGITLASFWLMLLPHEASLPARNTEPPLNPTGQRQNAATTFHVTLLEAWENGWEFQKKIESTKKWFSSNIGITLSFTLGFSCWWPSYWAPNLPHWDNLQLLPLCLVCCHITGGPPHSQQSWPGAISSVSNSVPQPFVTLRWENVFFPPSKSSTLLQDLSVPVMTGYAWELLLHLREKFCPSDNVEKSKQKISNRI